MFNKLFYQKLHKGFSYAALMVAVLVFNQCSRNPVTGKKELSLMSEAQEKSLGQEADPQIQAEYGVYPDQKLQDYINEKGQAMVKVSHRSNLGFQFKVMDSHIVNAFAVPGGYVYFTRGILAHFNNEAQLMGVLGHEIGHVTARHGARQQTSQLFTQLGMIAAMVAVPQLAQFGEQLSMGTQLLGLKFSRNHESESDKLGVDYASRTGYDAKEMAGFFKTLGRLSKSEDGQSIPTFLSTHPDPDDRFTNVGKMAVEYQTANPNQTYAVNRDGYLRLIDGIIYGEDPRQGYVEKNVFYHPELKFQFPIPTGWKYQNSPTQFQMVSSDQKAMMILSLSPEKSLTEAADGFTKKYSLKVTERQNRTVNGLPAIIQIADQVPQQQQGQPQQQAPAAGQGVQVATVFIEYGGVIYHIIGATTQALFPTYENTFRSTMFGFAQLNDPAKINVQPDKIRIRSVVNDGTFAEAMQALGQPTSRLKELSVLNGMETTERVTRGTLIKTVAK